jgi:hypothetical protein
VFYRYRLEVCGLVVYGAIDKDLEKKFRLKAVERFSGQKGAVTKALEEAIKLWLKS